MFVDVASWLSDIITQHTRWFGNCFGFLPVITVSSSNFTDSGNRGPGHRHNSYLNHCGDGWRYIAPTFEDYPLGMGAYEHSHIALEQARDYQQNLHESVEDLDEANVQLTHMNRLAQSLRQIAEDERRAKEQLVANVSHELRTLRDRSFATSR